MKTLLRCLTLPLLWSPDVFAADAAPLVGPTQVVSVGFSLLAVVAAVVLVGWLYSRSQTFRNGQSRVINILAAQSLGPKERIVLVAIGGKQIVVGMTAAQLQTLHVFDQPVVDEAQAGPTATAFAARLRGALRKGSQQ